MKHYLIACSALAAVTAGCNQPASTDTANAATDNAIVAAAPAAECAPGEAKLAVTGLCQLQAAALVLGTPSAADKDCSWVVNEAKTAEDTAVLYRAAKCKDGTATLSFKASATGGSFALTESPYGKQEGEPYAMVEIIAAPDKQAILDFARKHIEDAKESARCQVVPVANREGWPKDALVVDEVPTPTAVDGIRSACGTYGLDEGAQTFWRISQGTGWFFQLGQETPMVDATSFVMIKRDAAGQWARI
jgi:hypothetical protein